MTTQKLPGGITQYSEFDNTGEAVGLRYTGQVMKTNEDGTTTTDPDGAWLSWSTENDVNGRVVHEWTAGGGAFTGAAGDAPGDAIPYDRAFSYDNAGRLAQVRDRTAASTGVDVSAPTAAACLTRTYGFDRNGNRVSKSSALSGTDGICTTTGATTANRAFDTADRPTTGANGAGAYAYDLMGRTTTLPASDSPHPANGAVSIGYYDNDLVRSISQGGTTTTFTLDAADRRSTETVVTAAGSAQTTRHYTDSSDNPAWVTTGTSSYRYLELIGSDLAMIVNETGAAKLTLENPLGGVVTSVELPSAGGAATSIEAWNSFDEYGSPDGASGVSTGPVEYGWHGTAQRAVDDSGLLLMGARIYNPVTGLFTSLDPVDGGNSTAYTYPTDPINESDLDGLICKCTVGPRGSGGGGLRVGSSNNGGVTRGGGGGRSTASRTGAGRKGPSKPKVKKGQSSKKKVKRNNSKYKGRSYGYTIYYRHRGRWHTWKYGITSQQKYWTRPKSQLRSCRQMMGGAQCKVGKRVHRFQTRSHALWWEFGSVYSYWARHGTCPPGQWRSCR